MSDNNVKGENRMKKKEKLICIRKKGGEESGYTLLEYCAGAAIIAGVLWGALSLMGENLGGLLDSIGQWAVARAGEIDTGGAPGE